MTTSTATHKVPTQRELMDDIQRFARERVDGILTEAGACRDFWYHATYERASTNFWSATVMRGGEMVGHAARKSKDQSIAAAVQDALRHA